MDVWRSDRDDYVRSWEDGFIYSQGLVSVVGQSVANALKRFNLAPKDFNRAAFYAPNARQLDVIAKKTGFDINTQINDVILPDVGNTGAAMALMSLVAVLEEASAGEKILLVSYGDGCACIFNPGNRNKRKLECLCQRLAGKARGAKKRRKPCSIKVFNAYACILKSFKSSIHHHIISAFVPVGTKFGAPHTYNGDFIFYTTHVCSPFLFLCRSYRAAFPPVVMDAVNIP